ncbi:MAG: CBS domain-containing protein [Magnetococcales bacterium]|nr:CBS domain-containing protein [Magnetococcales bacterium]
MDIPAPIAKKARPFFLSFFQALSDDMNTLINAPVECALTEIALRRGEDDLSELFETENSVALTLEDGLHSGHLYMVMDVTAAIALSGLMMMLPQAVVEKSVKTRDITEEIDEGFHEVANQIMGSLNTWVEKKLEGSHLFLESTEQVGAGELPAQVDREITYLDVGMEITVSKFRPAPVRWLLAREFANQLLRLELPASEEELAAAARKRGGAPVEEEPPPPPPPPTPPPVVRRPDEYEFDFDAQAFLARCNGSELPAPNEPGGLRVVMTLPPCTLSAHEEVSRAVAAAFQEEHRFIGMDRNGVVVRVIGQSDLRRVMGAFYGSKAATPREKALLQLPISKLNENQRMISILPQGTIDQAADLLKSHNLHALPVVASNGQLRGFVPIQALLLYYRKRA